MQEESLVSNLLQALSNKHLLWFVALLALATYTLYHKWPKIKRSFKKRLAHHTIYRFIDLTLAVPAFIVLAPLFFLLSMCLRLHFGKGGVLFKQKRVGKENKLFTLYKFKTMTDCRCPKGKLLSDAERLTKLGHLLRSSSLDELPSIFNVIRGDMSIVGPRPLVPEDLQAASKKEWERHVVKPGITGWAQINGRNHISNKEKFSLDLWYVNNRNHKVNAKIIYLTFWKVIKREGIYKKEQRVTLSEKT